MLLIRKPILFLLVLAVGASLAGGGRLSLRLLLDTAVALAVIPLIQLIAFALVFWTGGRRLPFAAAVDAFFCGSGPWFAAIAAMAAFGAIASPLQAAEWFGRIAAVAAIGAVLLSLRLDFAFFRSVLGRSPLRAAIDLAVHRGVGWTATVAYFIVMASPKIGSLIPNVAASLFGARP